MAELNSWKEIAGYLSVSVRTAQMWESQRGLPVRRLPGPRGRVLADSSELDAWRLSGEGPPAIAQQQQQPSPVPLLPANRRRWWWAATGIAIAGVFAAGLVRARWEAQYPALATLDATNFTTDYGQELSPSISPEGTHVAYFHIRAGEQIGDLLVREAGRSGVRTVATGFAKENYVRWSPDGSKLAFTRHDGGAAVLELAPARGGAIRRLALLRGQDRVFNLMNSQALGWFPKGDALCFSDRESAEGPLHLYRLEIGSGRRSQMTVAPDKAGGDVQCLPSPDGTQVAFVRYRSISEGELYVLEAATGQMRRITNLGAKFNGLAWLPGGRAVLAGASMQNNGTRLWMMPLDGGQPKPLTGRESFGKFPSVRETGEGLKVVYESGSRDENIWRWSKATGPQQVTKSRLADVFPNISMRGELAFISRRAGPPEVWISQSDGGNPYRATFLSGGYVDFPRWSPDGRSLAFAYPNGNDRDIYLLSRMQTLPVPFRLPNSEEGRASFSTDNRSIYFRSDRGGSKDIYRALVNAVELSLQKMTRGGGYEAFEDPEGQWLYYVKERERPGLWRMPTAGGEAVYVHGEVWEGRWAVGPDGIYFLTSREGRPAVEKIGWNGGASKLQFRLEPGKQPEAGLSVSADGQWVYWSQMDGIESDLMSGYLR